MSKLLIALLLFSVSTSSYSKQSAQTIFKQIKQSVKEYKQHKKEETLINILKQYIKLYSYTKSYHSYSLIVDEYKKDPKAFLQFAQRKLSKKDFLIIKYNIQNLLDESQRGTDF
jgi:hypothetical protein